MEGRIPTHLEVAGWRRAVEGAGGFTAVLHRGDNEAGSVLLLTIENGRNPRLWERMPQLDGTRPFIRLTIQNIENAYELSDYLQRRTRQDSDLWIVELDIVSPERFVEMRQD